MEVLQIRDPKLIQTKISLSKEKSLHVAVEDKVNQGQAAIKNGIIVEANSKVVDLAAFNAKAMITEALDLLSDAKAIVNDLDCEGSSRRLSQCLSRARESLEEGWDYIQTGHPLPH